MAKKTSPDGDAENEQDASAGALSARSEVEALRLMSREERIALLLKGLDAACGPMPRRQRAAPLRPAKTPRKN